MATPFVQGRLRNQPLTVTITTACAHCGQAMQLVVDSEMNFRVAKGSEKPLVFSPKIDWEAFTEPNIIKAF